MTGSIPALDTPSASGIIGRVGQPGAGRTAVLLAGVHGDEPAGVEAVSRVLAGLQACGVALGGEVVGVVGNPAALSAGRRYLDHDLNRLWHGDTVHGCVATDPSLDSVEQRRQRELLDLLTAVEVETGAPSLLVLDLHTTSAPGAPFTAISDTLASRAVARALPIPLLLGLEEVVSGTLLEWLDQRGCPAVLIEGGEHRGTETVERLEEAIWIALRAFGILPPEGNGAVSGRSLRSAAQGLPSVLEVFYRHPITSADQFRMQPGYRHFTTVRRGDRLARDRHGPVAAPMDGMLLMPLYESLGEDGFFLARPIRPVWLALSRLARAARVDRLLQRMPGVRETDGMVEVDPSLARYLVVPLFHLAGFRRCPDRDGKLRFVRRKEA